MNGDIRPIVKSDVEDLKVVLDSIELFPADLLDEMISDYFHNSASKDIWFTKLLNGTAVAIGFCAPEKLTRGTYNLYAIGIRNDLQGQGIGGAMMNYMECYLKSKGHRLLIVETSGMPEFALTRQFYVKKGYTKEAIIRDFWSEGDDKVIFWKKLD